MTGRPRRSQLVILAVAVVAVVAVAMAGCGARLTSQQRAAGILLSIRYSTDQANSTAAPTATVGPSDVTTSSIAAQPLRALRTGAGTVASQATRSEPVASAPISAGQRSSTAPGQVAASAPRAAASASAQTSGCRAGALTASDVGVTPTTITIINSADLTGPVPGLFSTVQDGIKAFVAYFNATNQTVCGRKLVLTTADSGESESGDHDAAVAACAKSFAMVGGDSGFDAGGAPVVQQCGIPDIRASGNSQQRIAVPNVFAVAADDLHHFQPSIPAYFSQTFGDKVTQHAAIAYVNIGVGQQQAQRYAAGLRAVGWKVADQIPFDVSDFSYTPYAQKLKDDGVDFVWMIGAEAQYARMAQAMQSQHYKPDVFLLTPNAYDQIYTDAAGSAAAGSYVYVNAARFDQASSVPELQLYLTWLNRVDPNAAPSWFGELAWSAARLFVTEAQKVGPNLTREALITQLASVDNWTSNGLTSPQHIGSRIVSDCWAIIQWTGNAWIQSSAAEYTCTPKAIPVTY